MDITNILKQIKLSKSSSQPLYLQIADFLEDKIKEGLIPAETKLPPERILAKLLGVSRTTAINAYRQLDLDGLVETKIGSGTYVNRIKGQEKRPSIPWEQLFVPHLKSPLSSILRSLVSESINTISLAAGIPDPKLYPLETIRVLFNKYNQEMNPGDFSHIPTEGYTPLRKTICQLYKEKNISIEQDNVLITAGSQQGLYLLNKVLIEPGDYIIVESPTYIGAIQVFQHSGAKILTIPRLDELPLSILEDYLIRYRPKFFYLIPTFQNPTGHVLSLKQRQELLDLAARYQLIIIEDDCYNELYYDQQPPPSLKSLDKYNLVIHLGTVSKTIFPGFRTGWFIGPPILINRLSLEKQYMDLHCSNISQWLLNILLKENILKDHLLKVRKEYKKRRDTMHNSIQRYCSNMLTYTLPQGGFYFWCQLPEWITSTMLLHEVSKVGVAFVPGEAFYTNNSGSNKIRLCFTTQDEEHLGEGIQRLGKVLKSFSKNQRKDALSEFTTGIPIT